MPFAVLMTETLSQREVRDREKGYSEEYIQARDSREMWYVLNYVLAIVTIAIINLVSMGIPILLRTTIIVVTSIIFVLSVWKFLKSIRSQ